MPVTKQPHAVTISGNTTSGGAGTALISTGTLTLAGGNNVTLSQDGNAITISGANAGGVQTGISGIANSETTYTSGSVTLSGLANITIRSTTGQHFQFSVAAQSVQTQNITADQISVGVSTGGNTAGNTTVNTGSRLVLVGTDNISLSQGTAAGATTISIRDMHSTGTTVSSVGSANAVGANNSRYAQEAHVHEGVRRIGISTQGNTSGTTGFFPGSNFQFVGSNGITLSQGTDAASNATITISGITQSVQTQGGFASMGVSTGGNTAGNTTVNTGSRLVFVGSDNITLSQATAAGATTISVLGATVAGGAGMSAGLSNVGNTSGDTGVVTGRLVLAGGNNVTLSGSTNAGSMTITASVPNTSSQSVQTQGIPFVGLSTGGNTLGNTTVNSGTRLVLVGTNGITLSQGTAADATTITISGPTLAGQATYSGYNHYADLPLITGQVGQGTLQIDPMRLDNPIQFDRLVMALHNTNSSNSSGSHTLSFWVGLYTRNASTLSLSVSTSSTTAITHSGTAGSYSLYSSGPRLFTIPWTQTLTDTDMWLAVVSRTTSGGANGSYSQWMVSNINSNFMGHFGSSHATTAQLTIGQGVYTASTAGMPGSIAFSHLRGSDSQALRAPLIMFASGTV